MTNRLFVALLIPDKILSEIIVLRDEIYGKDKFVRWEPKDKLHITLKFLGEVKSSQINELISELEIISNAYSPIELGLNNFGIFYRNKNPKILWLGFKYNKNLVNLNDKINLAFKKFDFEPERRKFKPHLTLLRIRGSEDQRRIKKFLEYQMPEIKFVSDELSLIKSELTPKGSRYTILQSFKLNYT